MAALSALAMPDLLALYAPEPKRSAGILPERLSIAAPVSRPEPEPRAATGRTWGETAGDVGAGLLKGGFGMATGLANLADLASFGAVSGITRGVGGLVDRALGGTGEGYTLQEGANRIDEGIASLESDPLRQRRAQLQERLAGVGTQGGISGGLEKFWESAKETATDPMLLGQMLVEQVPLLAMMGAGTVGTAGRAANAARAAGPMLPGVAEGIGARAATRANIGFSGALGAGYASQQAAQDVLRASPEQLAASPDYRALVESGMSDRETRAKLALEAGYPAAAIAGPVSALTAGITAPLETAAFLGQLPKGIGPVAGAMGREALEEIPQESSEQIGTKVGVRQAGIDRDLWEGVPEAAGAAGVAGGLIGAGLGGVNVAMRPRTPGKPDFAPPATVPGEAETAPAQAPELATAPEGLNEPLPDTGPISRAANLSAPAPLRAALNPPAADPYADFIDQQPSTRETAHAIEERQRQTRDLIEHPGTDEFRQTQKAGGGDSLVQGGQEQVQAPEAVAPPSTLQGLAVQEIPLDRLSLSEDVPQFKSGANAKTGVVEPLGGKYERVGTAPIIVWERADGGQEVISGRHRLDLARRSGETSIPAQVLRETDGFTARQAAILDAELNIRDGQGKVKDYVQYFQNAGITQEEANLRGLVSRRVGKTAFAIADEGAPGLVAGHRADQLSDDAAYRIARTAPRDERLQAVGIKAIQDGKSVATATNLMQAVKAMAAERGATDPTLDMFGFDDSALREAETMAGIADRHQRQLSERLAAVQGAAKRPEQARELGVDVADPQAVLAKIGELKAEREAWANWSTSPELVARIRERMEPVRASRASAASADPTATARTLAAHPEVKALGDRVSVVERQAELRPELQPEDGGAVKAVIDGGRIVLVGEHWTAADLANLDGVLQHEGGVHLAKDSGFYDPQVQAAGKVLRAVGLKALAGEASWSDVTRQLDALRKNGNASVRRAFAAAERAGASPELLHEEALGYLAELNPEHSVIRRLAATVRAALYRMGVRVKLGDAELVALARIGLKRQARRQMGGHGGTWGENAIPSQGGRFSLPDLRRATTLDEAKIQAKIFVGTPLKNRSTRLVAEVSNTNIAKMTSRSAVVKSTSAKDHALAIANLDSLFEGALLDRSHADSKGEPTIRAIHRYVATMATDDGVVAVKMTVKETTSEKQPNPIYSVETIETAKPALGAPEGIEREPGQDRNSPQAGFDASIPPTGQNRHSRAEALGQSNPDLTADELLARVRSGEVSELTPEQWARVQAAFLGTAAKPATGVDAPSFKRWFGDSKIKGKDGRPLAMYHGTSADFTAFDATRAGQSTTHPTASIGFFFTNDRAHAAGKYGGNVMEVYLAIENPYPMTDADLRAIGSLEDARAFRAKLEARGHDGIVMPAETRTRYVAAFRPDQIKRIDNASYTRGVPDIRYSRAGVWTENLPAPVRSMAEKIGADPKPPGERLAAMRANLGTRLRQGMVDRFARLLDNDRARFGQDATDTDTALSAWVAAKMSKSPEGALEAAFLHGRLTWEDGALNVQETDRGLAKALEPVARAGELNRFWQWIIAHRSERLMSEGRERLFTAAEIAAGKRLNEGTMADGSSRNEVYRRTFGRYRVIQKSVLDIAQETGLFSANQRAQWEHDFYLPFYRVIDDEGEVRGPGGGGTLVRQKAFEKLKGGTEKLGDLLANILKNWHHLIDASLKNRAASMALDTAEALGIARKVADAQADKTSVWVLKDGAKVHYNVADPLTLEAISAISSPWIQGGAVRAMAAFKRALTVGVTISPAFKARNLLRDSIAALAVSGLSPNALGNVAKGFRAAKEGSATQASLLAGGGIFRFGTMLEGDPRAAQRRIAGWKPDTVLDSPAKVRGLLDRLQKGLEGWNRFGDRLESANRAALYEQLRKKNKTHLQAALAARDLMDFAQSGAGPATRFLTAVVPFLNARIQGLDVLYRKGFKPLAKTLAGRASAGEKGRAARFAATTFTVGLASALLYLAYKDDEEFKRREQHDRDTYWWFKVGDTPYRIPKPFEVGALGTLAERLVEQLADPEAGGALFAERLKHMLLQTFSFDIVPQMAKPLLEVGANRDSFTRRPIETLDMERLSPELRRRADTSALAVGLSRAGLGKVGLSPVQIEHLTRGYLGWIGAQALLVGDMVARPLLDLPDKPVKLKDAPLVGDLMQSFAPDGRGSRYLTEFYDQLKVLRQVHADANLLRKLGDREGFDALVAERGKELAQSRGAEAVARTIAELGQAERAIANSRTLDGAEKRARIDVLARQKEQVARRMRAALAP